MFPPLLHRTRGPQRRVESLSRASLSFSSLSSSLSLSTYPSVYIYSYPLLLRGCSFIPRHATFVSFARFLLHFSTFLFFIIIFFFFFGKSKGLVFSNSAYFFPSPLRACVANDSANSGGYFIFFLFSRIWKRDARNVCFELTFARRNDLRENDVQEQGIRVPLYAVFPPITYSYVDTNDSRRSSPGGGGRESGL